MVTKNVDNRWIRRYKVFLIVGLFILVFQLYLAIRFFALNNDTVQPPAVHIWSPHKTWKADTGEAESNVNSARKSKDGFVLDDEDLKFNEKQIKYKVSSDRNQSSNKTNLKLRLEELDFTPSCEIKSREAISAIHRAKTQKCKREISNITCLIQQNVLYPASLPNYCSSREFVKGKVLGCFKDEKAYRLLNGYYGNNKKGNSPEYCINLCLQSGFPYAGVEYSTECFCGNDEPSSTVKLPDSSCNMKCPSDPHLACGGYYAINVYQTGITKFVPQVAEVAVTENQIPVKIAFLLTLNGRALRQVKRLIKNLFHQDHYYFIHIDVRQDYLFRELLSLEKQFLNVKLSRRRYATIWGGASLLEMLLSVMRELLQLNWDWDFIINLSESDYPVKTLGRLVTFLSANRNKNFVKSHGREVQRFIQKQGLDKTFVECDVHMWRIGDRRLPWGIQIDGGSDWIALSRKFVSYVVRNSDDLVKGLFVVFKYTLLPAESFFHTVLRNSKFCDTYVDNNLHVTNWKRKLGCKCQYKHIVDWCGCSPNDFKPEDWLRIQNTESRQLYFARKFEPIINQAIILQLEQWLYKTDHLTRIPNVNSYWESVYNYLDLGTPVDDSLLTISHSTARITSKNLSSNTCAISSNKILEVTSYHVNDIYQSTLISFEAMTPHHGKVVMEATLKPKNQLILTSVSEFTSRIKSLSVSSNYDQKEQISRNFGRILGPYSDPVLIYEFSASPNLSAKNCNVSFLWLDSAGHLLEISELVVEESYTMGHVKSSLKQPLLPGSWSVKLVHKNRELAQVRFLILPLEYYSGNFVSPSQVHFIHSGAGFHKEFDPQWDELLPNYVNQERLEQLSVSNSKRFGPDLQEWIDTLVNKFYKVGNVCVKSGSSVCGKVMTECHFTDWSSLAPDPKSNIGKVNETTGMFDLW